MDTKQTVLDTLKKSGTMMKSAEIAEKTGIDKAQVDKALKALKSENKVTSPKMCYYSA
ncbi:MAG: helix-turn-helix domain-containing protein [Bacteroidales bacterium]|nr:helix-turn-helix domain-containing protein [Bacteroidales bacterium]